MNRFWYDTAVPRIQLVYQCDQPAQITTLMVVNYRDNRHLLEITGSRCRYIKQLPESLLGPTLFTNERIYSLQKPKKGVELGFAVFRPDRQSGALVRKPLAAPPETHEFNI